MATIGQVISVPGSLKLSSLKLSWPRLPHPALVIALAGAVVETLLGLRLWAQLSAQEASGLTAALFQLTDILVGPFRDVEPTATVKSTGIFELATLMAIEVYLIVTLAALCFVFATQGLYRAAGRAVYRQTAARSLRQ
jgi:hypothetical protein